MAQVTVSSKYQIVIPQDVRSAAKIKPGTKLEIVLFNGYLHIVPVKSLGSQYGSLKGMDTTVEPDEDRF